MNSWKRSFGGAIEVGAGAGPRSEAGGLMAGLQQQTGGIIIGEKRSGERRQRKRGKIFLAFQTGWLNRWGELLKL